MQTENEKEDESILKRKAEIYQKLGSTVHINYKKGYWKRGLILEISSDFFILEERLEGKIPVFYIEITDIQPFRRLDNGK